MTIDVSSKANKDKFSLRLGLKVLSIVKRKASSKVERELVMCEDRSLVPHHT